MIIRTKGMLPAHSRAAVLVLCMLLLPTAAHANELTIENDFSVTKNTISGPGADNSSLTRGFRYANEWKVASLKQTGDKETSFQFTLKATNDRAIDSQTLSLTNFEFKSKNKTQTTMIGDVYNSFADYSFSSAVKGFSYRYYDEEKKGPELTVTYGYMYPRWDNFWGGISQKVIERKVLGTRIRQDFSDTFWAGINFVHTKDNNRVTGTDDLWSGSNYTVDWEYRNPVDMAFHGESSFSQMTKNSTSDWGVTYSDSKHNGFAHKINMLKEGSPSRLEVEYEIVSPQFETFVGSAIKDREKVKAKWRNKLNDNTSIRINTLWFHDKVNDDSTAMNRTTNHSPEVGFIFKSPWGREDAFLDVGFRMDRRYGGVSGENTKDHHIIVNYQDKIGEFETDTNLIYTKYNTTYSDNTGNNRSHEFTYNTALSMRRETKNYILQPAIYWGFWDAYNELVGKREKAYETSLGLGVNTKDSLLTSNIKVGQKHMVKESGNANWFANVTLEYKAPFLAKRNGKVYVKAFINDYKFDSATNNNYRETSITTGFTMAF